MSRSDFIILKEDFTTDFVPYRFIYDIPTGWILAEKQEYDSKKWVEGADLFTEDEWSEQLMDIIVSFIPKLSFKLEDKSFKIV